MFLDTLSFRAGGGKVLHERRTFRHGIKGKGTTAANAIWKKNNVTGLT